MAKRLTDRRISWFEDVKRRAREYTPPTPPQQILPSASYPSIYAREGIGEHLARQQRRSRDDA